MHADVTVGQCVEAFLTGRNDFFDFEIQPGRAVDA
jgi:hypothetical protein